MFVYLPYVFLFFKTTKVGNILNGLKMITACVLENINLKLSFLTIVFGVFIVQSKAKTCSLHTDCDLKSACVNGVCVNPCGIRKCGPNSECKTFNHKSICVCHKSFEQNENGFGCRFDDTFSKGVTHVGTRLVEDWYVVQKIPSHKLAFKLKAAYDGRIIFRKAFYWSKYVETDQIVEIIIGGPHNKTVIRRNHEDKAEAYTPNILSKNDFRGFWIAYSRREYVFGREFETKPLVQWNDPDPFYILSFGIASSSTETAEWIIHGKSFKTPRGTEYIFRPMLYSFGVVESHANAEVWMAYYSVDEFDKWDLYLRGEVHIGREQNTVHEVYLNHKKYESFHKPGRILNSSDNTVMYQIHWSQGFVSVINSHNQEGVIFKSEFPHFLQPEVVGFILPQGNFLKFSLYRTTGFNW